MAREESIVKMSADDAEVDRAWAKQFEYMRRLEAALRQAGVQAGITGKLGLKSFTDWSFGISHVQRAVQMMIGELEKARAAQERFVSASARTTTDSNVSEQLLFGQASGLADPKAQAEARKRMSELAQRYSASYTQATDAARQLISLGMAEQDVFREGGGLDVALAVSSAMGGLQQGQDQAGFVAGLMKAMPAFQLDKTPENMLKVGVGMQRLFKNTSLQASSVERFASVASSVSELGNTDIETALAALSTLTDVTDESQAATGLRNVVNILATAGGEEKKRGALASMGLAAEDVDFEGENLIEVLQTLKQAIEQMDPSDAKNTLNALFGRENMGHALTLMNSVGAIGERRAGMYDEAAFRRDVGVATSGDAAESRRVQERVRASEVNSANAVAERIAAEIEAVGRESGWTQQQIDIVRDTFRESFAAGATIPEALSGAIAGERTTAADAGAGAKVSAFVSNITSWSRAANAPGSTPEAMAAGNEILRRHTEALEALVEQQKQPQKVVVEIDGAERPGRKVAP